MWDFNVILFKCKYKKRYELKFLNKQHIKNLNVHFYKGSIDVKSALKFLKCPLVAELKLKMMQF